MVSAGISYTVTAESNFEMKLRNPNDLFYSIHQVFTNALLRSYHIKLGFLLDSKDVMGKFWNPKEKGTTNKKGNKIRIIIPRSILL
jgi:hypothetical protein